MKNLEKQNKELQEEIQKLKAKIEKIKAKKKYGLVWEEEKEPEKIVLDCQYKVPILKEIKSKKIITDKNKPINILIEGDNFNALSVLNYTHKGIVDILYIDPPYNTGDDEFKYNDKYIDAEDSYRHSKWLSFMEKRLKLAFNLLNDTGIIIIHIDEHEIDKLYMLLTSIFGDDNDLGRIIWDKRNPKGDSKGVSVLHETILCFAKNRDMFLQLPMVMKREKPNASLMINKANKLFSKLGKEMISENVASILKPYNYSKKKLDQFKVKYNLGLINKEYQAWLELQNYSEGEKAYKYIDKNGDVFRPVSMAWPNKETAPKEYFKPLIHPITRKPCPVPKRGWRNPPNTMEELLRKNLILFGKDHHTQPNRKYLLKENLYENVPSIYSYGASDDSFFDEIGLKFQYMKPLEVAKYLIKTLHPSPRVIIDFFAGSGTAGHAVLELNNEDSKERQFILCTNNENNICTEVCYPRIEKAIKGYKNRNGEDVGGLVSNLKYFITDFIDVDHISHISDEQRIKLTYQAGEMIAIRENTFEEVEKNEWWQIFKNGEKFAAIYFKENKTNLNELVRKLIKNKQEVALYIFSWGKNEYKNEFSEYKNIRVEDIPEPIIEVYKEINRL